MTDPARPRSAARPLAGQPPAGQGVLTDPRERGLLARRLPFLLILAVALPGAFLLRGHLDFATLAGHRADLLAFRDANYALAALVFSLAYIGIVAFSLPGATVATLTGGFLFGLFPGVLFNVTAATAGAVLIFLAARAGFGAGFARTVEARGGAAARLQAGLRDNEWSVLFLMRLVPALPFFLANLLPAFMGARLHRFAITTFLGIIPGALVYTSVGAGLDEVIARGETPDLSLILAPEILFPILGLAALAALPLLIRLLRRKEG